MHIFFVIHAYVYVSVFVSVSVSVSVSVYACVCMYINILPIYRCINLSTRHTISSWMEAQKVFLGSKSNSSTLGV